MSEFQVITQSYVSLTIVTPSKEFGVEKRFPKDILVADLKNKLEMISGFVASDISMKLLTKDKKFVCDLNDEEKMLGYYPVEDGYLLEVTGQKTVLGTPIGEVDPNVKKFELTDEEYAKKKGTIKEFKQKMKLGQYSDPSVLEEKEKQAREKIENEKKAVESMKVGDRCQVSLAGAPTRLGTVMYLGEIKNKPGYFVGVKYDEPLGKNDGSIDGQRYFQCSPNYGGFLKPEFVQVGDFPEENFDEL